MKRRSRVCAAAMLWAAAGILLVSSLAEAQMVVSIPDPNLEGAIRGTLSKYEGDLTDTDLAALASLELWYCGVVDLTGLEYAVNLQWLVVYDNQVSDLSPLANLTGLMYLILDGNQVSDLSPLANLTNLWVLTLNGNQVSHLSPLAGLTGLMYLYLDWNPVSDLSALVANPGMDSGDYISLLYCPLNTVALHDQIPSLRERGVYVDTPLVVRWGL